MEGASGTAYPRALNERESTLLLWCASRLSQCDGAALQEQLANCQVVDEDNGGIWFQISPKSRTVQAQGIDLTYSDFDGGPVEFIIAFVGGYLEWVDRYRMADSAPVQKLVPTPAEIRSWQGVPIVGS
jgi:hypothetical protein